MNCKRALRVAAMVLVMMCTLRIGEAPGVRPSILSLFRSYKTHPGRFLLPSIQDSCIVLGTASPPGRA